jgi:hypothetical protein
MQPIAVQMITLQAMMPDVTLRPGQSLVARVAERHDRHGILVIGGNPLVAELPEGVHPGDVLKLTVKDLTADKVVMQIREGQETAQMNNQTAIPVGIPFPDGNPARVNVDDKSGGGGSGDPSVAAVALTYESPALGPVNLRIGMDAGTVVADIRIAAGAPLELAQGMADVLRDALAQATERVASVSVTPRPGSFDVSA